MGSDAVVMYLVLHIAPPTITAETCYVFEIAFLSLHSFRASLTTR
ncbi:hypothetical protein HSB1_35190 [Halogranum salarium B-1]|uniref:Uncharacterized protein n=1 Tax=Halogranum salarium B-1 TaxID=1210908 RepID=J3EUL4_9EURY|nr:hypothetical protein HSB1_35190 [Halogranum salarium B-1]